MLSHLHLTFWFSSMAIRPRQTQYISWEHIFVSPLLCNIVENEMNMPGKQWQDVKWRQVRRTIWGRLGETHLIGLLCRFMENCIEP